MSDLDLEIAIAIAKAKRARSSGDLSVLDRAQFHADRRNPPSGVLERAQVRDQGINPPQEVPFGGAAREAFNAATLGFGDNVLAGGRTLTQGGTYQDNLADVRGEMRDFRTEHPVASTVSAVAGGAAIPAGGARSLLGMVGRSALAGGIFAGADADDEETLGGRVREGVEGAAVAGLFTAGAAPMLRKVFGKLPPRPTLRQLAAAEKKAYAAVEASKHRYTVQQYDDMMAAINARLNDPASGFVPGDKQVENALTLLQRNRGEKSMTQLDNIRKRLWQRWKGAKSFEQDSLLDVIDELDTLIGTGDDAAILAARETHKVKRRAEILDAAFEKAERARGSAFSGGNLNAYRSVVKNILNSPQQSRWFTSEQRAAMDLFIDSDMSNRALRTIAKLSPDGNGLMMALTFFAGAIDPKLLAGAGAGAVAKNIEEGKLVRGMEGLRDSAVFGAPRPAPRVTAVPVGVGAVSLEDRVTQ